MLRLALWIQVIACLALCGCKGQAKKKYDAGVESADSDLDLAIANFTEAIRLKKKYVDAHFRRGLVFFRKGDYDRAIADFTTAVSANSDNQYYRTARGLARACKRDFEGALTDFDTVLQSEPKEELLNDVKRLRKAVAGLQGAGALAVVAPEPPEPPDIPVEPEVPTAVSSKPGFWKLGLAGICGGKKAWWAWILSIIVFLFTSLIAMVIIAAIGATIDEQGGEGGAASFFGFAIVGGLWYLISWGIPAGVWWAIPILYALVGGAGSAGICEDM
jgi:tetratricopeptide (TPR) repeat protein